MPLRRAANGGWERVSRTQIAQEEQEMHAIVAAGNGTEDAVIRAGGGGQSSPTESSSKKESGEYTGWASEGMRRVRADQVVHKMRYLTAMAAIGGFLFGYDTGVISGAMLPIKRQFDLSRSQEQVVVSSTVLAAFFSSLVGGTLNNSLGRRIAILYAAAVFTVGSVMLMSAWSYHTLVAGRVVVGIGIGIASLTTPIYIAEVAVPSSKSSLGRSACHCWGNLVCVCRHHLHSQRAV
jgi:hypothetical protein